MDVAALMVDTGPYTRSGRSGFGLPPLLHALRETLYAGLVRADRGTGVGCIGYAMRHAYYLTNHNTAVLPCHYQS